MDKIKFIGIVVLLVCFIPLWGFAKEEAIVGLTDHELGDQTLAINAGLIIPLPFLSFSGIGYASNQTLGGAGTLQWNAYLNSWLRVGLQIGIAFNFGPDFTAFLMVPMLTQATYVLNIDRFEIPISLGVGLDIIKYGREDLFDIALFIKPGTALYYRYDSNLSFGLNLDWWCNLEMPAQDYNHVIMGNSLIIAPALFYHF